MAAPIVRQNRTGAPLEDRRALETVSDLVAQLGAPFLRGREVSFEVTAAGSHRQPHGLGYTPRGWLVTDATGAAPALYREAWDDRAITFNCAAACAVTLWVW